MKLQSGCLFWMNLSFLFCLLSLPCIWECRSLLMTCNWPRLMSLRSIGLRFLFIRLSLMCGRCGNYNTRTKLSEVECIVFFEGPFEHYSEDNPAQHYSWTLVWLTRSATGDLRCSWICLSTSTCMRAMGRANARATRASSCSRRCNRQNSESSESRSSSPVSRSDREELCLL